MILEALIIAMILGLCNSTIILALWDFGLFTYLQVISPNKILYKLFSCMFCQGFWIAVIETVIIMSVYKNTFLLFVPFASAAITRKMTA